MKTKRFVENENELLDILMHQDVVLNVEIIGEVNFELKSSDGYSSDELSTLQLYKMVESVFHNLGAVVHIKHG